MALLSVKGTFSSLVDYTSSLKAKKVKDAVLYVAITNVNPAKVTFVVVDEDLRWTLSDDVTENKFLSFFPKAVKIEQIF